MTLSSYNNETNNKHLDPLNTDPKTVADNWNKFRNDLETFFQHHQNQENVKLSSETKVAILLNFIGADGLKLFNELQLNESQVNDFDELLAALESKCFTIAAPPNPNEQTIIYKRSVFHQRQQNNDETFDQYFDDCKQLAKLCDFGMAEERQLRDRICVGIKDDVTRKYLEKMPNDYSLANIVNYCRMAELLRHKSYDTLCKAVIPDNFGDCGIGISEFTTSGIVGSIINDNKAINGNQTKKITTSSTECVLQNIKINNQENSIEMRPEHMCGLSCWHPKWLQRFANPKSFLIVFGLMGTVQSMAYLYFVVTLTTIEKRFKIPSYTTGIVLSGNEISQILLSLILSYAGGHGNRPRWLAWGSVFCALSCFILAVPHLIFGPGDEALQLTKEYYETNFNVSSVLTTNSTPIGTANKLCVGITKKDECDEFFSTLPLILIFLSQFVLGIGNTLYYSLGQTYLDDNSKKGNTPLLLAYAMTLRMAGPIFGFLLGYLSLRIYIDPTKTPIIERDDPRWLGAWWLGWNLLGIILLMSSVVMGLFPKVLAKPGQLQDQSSAERCVSGDDEEESFTKNNRVDVGAENYTDKTTIEKPKLKDLPKALLRLLKNKLLIFNNLAGVFYILGSSGYITFLSKYMEVQFNKNSTDATIITGPLTIAGMTTGFLLSGWIISKYRPTPRKLFFWNVIVGFGYMIGQVIYLFLTCDNNAILNELGALNLTSACNANCSCDGVLYSPVCQVETGKTYFSPCHAGCNKWHASKKIYSHCTCAGNSDNFVGSPWYQSTALLKPDGDINYRNEHTTTPPNDQLLLGSFYLDFTSPKSILYTEQPSDPLVITTEHDHFHEYEEVSFLEHFPDTDPDNSITDALQLTTPISISTYEVNNIPLEHDNTEELISSSTLSASNKVKLDDFMSTTSTLLELSLPLSASLIAEKEDESFLPNTLKPGPCLAGCAFGFYMFTTISMLINWLGATGRIGNVLLSFRCVTPAEKSFSQGLTLMMLSLFALIPGPIIYGYIIDETCIKWNYKCGERGNCQLYDQTKFRYYMNLTALSLTFVGVFFDFLVWWFGQNVDLYSEDNDRKEENEIDRRNQPISPLIKTDKPT